MGWNLRTISVAMLVVLCMLPVSGTLCALACDEAAHPEGSGHHHEAAADASQPATADLPLIGAASAHRCDHAAAIEQATRAPERAYTTVSTAAAIATASAFAAPLHPRVRPSHGAPPGSTPPTSTPLVLRV